MAALQSAPVASAARPVRCSAAPTHRPAGGGPLRRLLRAAPPKQPLAPEEEAPARQQPAAPSGARPGLQQAVKDSVEDLGILASILLRNAASLRMVRGQTHCMACRGTGKCSCPACQGEGITKEPARMNQVVHAVHKVQIRLGLNSPKMFDDDWMQSNRCKRCRGTGALPCPYCEGSGRLGP